MIEDGSIKVGDRVFLYRENYDKSVAGIVKNISYPILKISILKDDKEEIIEVDVSNNVPLTLLNDNQIENCLTKEQQKIFKKEDETPIDIFSGMY